MKKLFTAALILLMILLPACTDQEFIQALCEKPEGYKEMMLCWFLGSANEPKQQCYTDSDCKGSCGNSINVMEGRCNNHKCSIEYSYSCQENGIDAKCYMEGNKPKCTTPANQCSGDDQCPSKCQEKNVLDGKCTGGRCEYDFAYSCEENGIDSKCIMQGDKATCTQPANQCAFDDDCTGACKDDDVMEGVCNGGRCALKYVETCDTALICKVEGGAAYCK